MADDVLTRDGPVSVPMNYVVPAGGELIPLMVIATMDGTSAAGAFYAAVQVIAPSGRVMGTAITSSIAAGASATATWFPGVGGSGSGAVQSLVGARIQASSGQSIPNATNTDLVYQDVYFDTNGMASLGTNSRILTVNTAGIYLVTVATAWDYLANAEGRRINVVLQNGYYSVGGVPDQFSVVDERMPIWAVSGLSPPAPRTTNLVQGIFKAVAGDFFSSGVYQASGGAATANGYAFCFLSAVLIGSG